MAVQFEDVRKGSNHMRVGLISIFQLTNTFSRQSTQFEDFSSILAAEKREHQCDSFGLRSLIHTLIDTGRDRSMEVVPLTTRFARSSGPATTDSVAALSAQIATSIEREAGDLDALIMILSGSMIAEDYSSADQSFCIAARSVLRPSAPILAVLSDRANLSIDLVNSVTVAMSFELGNERANEPVSARAIDLVGSLVRGEFQPVAAFRKLHLLMPPYASHSEAPLSDAWSIARDLEAGSDILAANLFPGFPFADVASAGTTILVTTNSNQDNAERAAERLQRAIWDRREGSGPGLLPNIETAVHESMLATSGPVIIADAGDDPSLGAAGDGTGLLWALIDLGARDAALGVVVDAQAVARAIDEGIGKSFKFDIGGTIDRTAGYPINVSARVSRISDGRLRFVEGCDLQLGRTVVLDVEGRHGGQIDVILCERPPVEIGPELFARLGVDIGRKQIVGVKCSMRVRERFSSVSPTVQVTTTPGITTPILSFFDYKRVPRPTFPLDPM
jgi:microcystin degradation protein MlrC